MALVNTDSLRRATAALKENGILKGGTAAAGSSKREVLDGLLSDANLGLETVIENVSLIARTAEDESLRLKANDLALRLHGVLKDEKGSDGPSQVVLQIVGDNVNMAFLQPTV